YPTEIPAKLKTLPAMLKQALPPAAANVGVEALLTAVGMPAAGLLPLAARAIAAGATNIATSKLLPEKYGGQPKASALEDFMWGAAPQALSSGIKGGANWYANRRLGQAGERMQSAAESSLLDPENLKVQQTLLSPPSKIPYPEISQPGPELTRQADEAR